MEGSVTFRYYTDFLGTLQQTAKMQRQKYRNNKRQLCFYRALPSICSRLRKSIDVDACFERGGSEQRLLRYLREIAREKDSKGRTLLIERFVRRANRSLHFSRCGETLRARI